MKSANSQYLYGKTILSTDFYLKISLCPFLLCNERWLTDSPAHQVTAATYLPSFGLGNKGNVVFWCFCQRGSGRLSVETELFRQDFAAGQAVSLAVTLSWIAQTEKQQSHYGPHGPTVCCVTQGREEAQEKNEKQTMAEEELRLRDRG